MSTNLKIRLILACTVLLIQTIKAYDGCSYFEFQVKAFLKQENEFLRQLKHAENLAAYNYNINITEPNRQASIAIATANAKAKKALALHLKGIPLYEIEDVSLLRQIKMLARLSFDVLPENDFQKLFNAISAMQMNYATTQVCAWNESALNLDQSSDECTLTLEPDINERLRNSRNPDELAYYWKAWYDAAGTPMRNNFKDYVELTRKSAKMNNFHSYAEDWLSYYEDPSLEKNLDTVYKKLLPFYTQLHAYVRYRLRQHYGPNVVPAFGNIPMHLLGNMWAQQWDQTIELYTPFPNVPLVDVTAALLSKGLTVKQVFELGNDYFKSLNMRELPQSFWNLSVLVKPTDRDIVCQASAWDLYQDSDVRIKMCTELNELYLKVIFHQLGHIQYYLQYENQPTVFRNAPIPGFHETIGDVIAITATTPKHLNRIGLLPTPTLSLRSRINELFKAAAQKVVFIPFALALEKFRLSVFRGEIDESVWNCAFWQLRSEFTGVEPPVVRTDFDFDPPAKYHVDADVEYLRFIAARILQFQVLKALCIKAGQYDPRDPTKPLDNCDIYGRKEVGEVLSNILSLGSSVRWKDALYLLTGQTSLDPTALLEYFEPLYKWLVFENSRLGVPLGWDDTDKVAPNCCPPFST